MYATRKLSKFRITVKGIIVERANWIRRIICCELGCSSRASREQLLEELRRGHAEQLGERLVADRFAHACQRRDALLERESRRDSVQARVRRECDELPRTPARRGHHTGEQHVLRDAAAPAQLNALWSPCEP